MVLRIARTTIGVWYFGQKRSFAASTKLNSEKGMFTNKNMALPAAKILAVFPPSGIHTPIKNRKAHRSKTVCRQMKMCTCKMKVDTHKSVGVYFFRCIIKKERM